MFAAIWSFFARVARSFASFCSRLTFVSWIFYRCFSCIICEHEQERAGKSQETNLLSNLASLLHLLALHLNLVVLLAEDLLGLELVLLLLLLLLRGLALLLVGIAGTLVVFLLLSLAGLGVDFDKAVLLELSFLAGTFLAKILLLGGFGRLLFLLVPQCEFTFSLALLLLNHLLLVALPDLFGSHLVLHH